MNRLRAKMRRIYAILLIAAIILVSSGINNFLSTTDSDRKNLNSAAKFNSYLWDRSRGEIYDRDGNKIVYNETKGDRLLRNYDSCTKAYSSVIGYHTVVSQTVTRNGGKTAVVKFEHNEGGVERTKSDWLLTGSSTNSPIGGSIVLTIDSRLQELCYEQIKDFSMGAVTVIDIETGEILALTDSPAYDTSAVVNSGTKENYESAIPENSLYQFATSPQIPGSVFKIISASVFCDAGMKDAQVDDSKIFEYNGEYRITNAGDEKNGKIGLAEAIRHSSNIYFANVSKQIGSQAMDKYLTEKWKFNQDIELDFVTLSPRVCLDNRQLLYNTAYGQGDLKVSPLYVCMATAAVGNKNGDLCKPYLYKEFINADGNTVKAMSGKKSIITKKAVSREARDIIIQGMTTRAKDLGIKNAAVKTGTAQIDGGKVNLWMTGIVFVGSSPKYAVTIAQFEVPEKGHFGSQLKGKFSAIADGLIKMNQ